eukprot:gene8695-34145_t
MACPYSPTPLSSIAVYTGARGAVLVSASVLSSVGVSGGAIGDDDDDRGDDSGMPSFANSSAFLSCVHQGQGSSVSVSMGARGAVSVSVSVLLSVGAGGIGGDYDDRGDGAGMPSFANSSAFHNCVHQGQGSSVSISVSVV